MATTTNIQPFDEQNTGNAGGTKIAKHPKSRPGLNYGTDGLKKITMPDGTIRWVEKNVHPTKT